MFGTHAPDFGAASDGMSGSRLLLCFHVLSIDMPKIQCSCLCNEKLSVQDEAFYESINPLA